MAEPLPPQNEWQAVVLLPTYNERDNLPQLLREILVAAPVDVWVLDDNSPDGTGELAETLRSEHGTRLRVTHRPRKEGLGRAYLAGFRQALAAGYERIIQMDADFSHPPHVLPQMLHLSQHYDVVLGSRWVPGGGTENWPWRRRLISKGGSTYARWLLGLQVRDMTGGFKCFRRAVLQTLPLDTIRSSGYAFQVEVTFAAAQYGFSIVETPILFVERRDGASKMSRRIVWEAVWRVPQLRWRALRHKLMG